MIDRLFRAHPRSIGESYPAHFAVSSRVGLKMIAGGLACLVHAICPALFQRTGSATIRRLHAAITPRATDAHD